jgi:hypothetical protein
VVVRRNEEDTKISDLLPKNKPANKKNQQAVTTSDIMETLRGIPASVPTATRGTTTTLTSTPNIDLSESIYGIRIDPLASVSFNDTLRFDSGQQAVAWYMSQSLRDPKGYKNLDALLKAGGFSGSTPETRFASAVAYAQQTGIPMSEIINTRALEGYGIKEEEGGTKVNVGNILRSIQRSAVQRGIKLSKNQEKSLLNQAISQGWDSATLQENIARVGAVGESGEAAQTIDALRQFATAYGVEYNPSWYQNAAQLVLGGRTTLDAFQNEIKNLAKSKYMNYANLIDQGMSPNDIASPYMQVMANTLELDPTLVNLTNPIIEKALTRMGEDGKPNPMGLQEFMTLLKTDRSLGYSKTKQGQDDYLSTGLQLLGDLTGGVYRG